KALREEVEIRAPVLIWVGVVGRVDVCDLDVLLELDRLQAGFLERFENGLGLAQLEVAAIVEQRSHVVGAVGPGLGLALLRARLRACGLLLGGVFVLAGSAAGLLRSFLLAQKIEAVVRLLGP